MIMMAIVLGTFGRALSESGGAVLDTVDLTEIEKVGREAGVNVREMILSLISGEWPMDATAFQAALERAKAALLGDFRRLLPAIAIPMATALLTRLLLKAKNPGARIVQLIGRVAVIGALSSLFAEKTAAARSLLSALARCADAFAPALTTLAAIGGSSAAATLTPLTALLTTLIEKGLAQWGVALSAAAAGVAIAGNLSERISLKRLYDLLSQTTRWGAGTMMAAFMGLLSVQGRIGWNRDTAAIRTARYAVENLIPVVGGNVSDSLDSLVSAAQSVRNALGVSGLAVAAFVCLEPMLQIAGFAMLVKLCAAVAEPAGDDALSALLTQFAGALEMLLIACVAATVLCALLMGSCMTVAAAAAG